MFKIFFIVIKIGQSLSIRTDLIKPIYIKALTKLQDRVQSFSTIKSREIIESEFGVTVESLFPEGLEPTAQVVAAASLGQVFRARLVDGSDVAVKIQRPNIMEQIALDLFILRSFGPLLRDAFKLNTDIAAVVDDWGKGFVDELNYILEAQNAQIFMKSIVTTPLKDAVFAPEVIAACSSKRVLTTRWVEGERLELSSKEDITKLCSIAMNTYLTMLLGAPLLHCE